MVYRTQMQTALYGSQAWFFGSKDCKGVKPIFKISFRSNLPPSFCSPFLPNSGYSGRHRFFAIHTNWMRSALLSLFFLTFRYRHGNEQSRAIRSFQHATNAKIAVEPYIFITQLTTKPVSVHQSRRLGADSWIQANGFHYCPTICNVL